MMPLPPSLPPLTCTGPLPVPESVCFDHKSAAFNGRASGIGVSLTENQFARPDFGQRAAAPPLARHPEITPEKFVLRLLLPTVRFLAPRNTRPSPSMEPTVTPGAL